MEKTTIFTPSQAPVNHSGNAIIIGAASGGALVIALAAIFCIYKCHKRRKQSRKKQTTFSLVKAEAKHYGTQMGPSRQYTRHLPLVRSPVQDEGLVLPQRHSRSQSPNLFASDSVDSSQIDTETYKATDQQDKEGNTPEYREKMTYEEKTNANLGSISFSMEYNEDKLSLAVHIKNAFDLPLTDTSNVCDPYIKLQLLPDKKHKVKTRVLRKTQNPTYDEIFTFYGIHLIQLDQIKLHFVVLSFDRFSRDEIIGEILYPLKGKSIGGDKHVDISPRKHICESQGMGDILISLCYQPAANRVTVVVLKARNLPKMDITGAADPYVKIYLAHDGQRIAKKKTHIKKRCLNPVFNESFLFDVPATNEGLNNMGLEFTVMDWDRITKDEAMCRISIGSNSTGDALHHWNEMLNCPRKQIAQWHKLTEG